MKRLFIGILVFTLVFALAVPGVAMAKKGGVPANGTGAPSFAESGDDGPVDATPGASAGKEARAAEKRAAKDARAAEKRGAEAAESDGEATEPEAGEDGPTVEPKRTGIENALASVQRNLERMQTQIDEGSRSDLPPGLQKVMLKFMAWLGMSPDDGTVGDGDGATDGDSAGTAGNDDGTETGGEDETGFELDAVIP